MPPDKLSKTRKGFLPLGRHAITPFPWQLPFSGMSRALQDLASAAALV